VVELVSPSAGVERLLVVLAVAAAAAPLYLLAARRVDLRTLVPIVLALDTLFIAAMEAALQTPEFPSAAYFWAIALSAFLCGPQATLAYTALSIACALAVPYLAGFDVDGVVQTTGVFVLGLMGCILAYLSHAARRTEEQLEGERAADAAALQLAGMVHTAHSLDRILLVTVAEIGNACDVSHAALRLAKTEEGWPRLYQWTRPGGNRFDHPVPPEPVQRMFASGEPIVVDDLDVGDEETRAYLGSEGSRAFAALPVRWQGRVVAVVALQDDRPRRWEERGLPLLERIVPQLAAAIVQAELFEQQQATLARLEDLNRLREELVAQVSHELRTPLTSTLGFLHTLERTDVDFDDAERRALIGIARSEAERLAALVDDLLQLARLDRGAMQLELRPLEIAGVVRRAAGSLAFPDERRLTLELDADLVAQGDEKRLLQVFSNLLTNAIRHGEGEVRVIGEPAEEEVVISVSDEGPGIPPDRQADLFLPFAHWSPSHESTGLGLAIAQGIVRAHGGTLEYRPPGSEGPQGFVVRLPRTAAAQPRLAGAARGV